jgi:mono/diheme cytochrome c family protein
VSRNAPALPLVLLVVVLVGALTGCSSSTTTTAAPGPTATTAAAATGATTGVAATGDGKQLYAANCAGCHGASGQGGSALAIAGAGFPEAMLESVIANGKGDMPAYQGRLQPGEITAIAQYVTGGFQ